MSAAEERRIGCLQENIANGAAMPEGMSLADAFEKKEFVRAKVER